MAVTGKRKRDVKEEDEVEVKEEEENGDLLTKVMKKVARPTANANASSRTMWTPATKSETAAADDAMSCFLRTHREKCAEAEKARKEWKGTEAEWRESPQAKEANRYYLRNAQQIMYLLGFIEKKKARAAKMPASQQFHVDTIFEGSHRLRKQQAEREEREWKEEETRAKLMCCFYFRDKPMMRSSKLLLGGGASIGAGGKAGLCQACGVGTYVLFEDDVVLVCENPKCGHQATIMVEAKAPSVGGGGGGAAFSNEMVMPDLTHSTAPQHSQYERMFHFKEMLEPFRSAQSKPIPEVVMEAVRYQIRKEKITVATDIDYEKMRDILKILNETGICKHNKPNKSCKECGYNNYFGQIHTINAALGIKVPYMTDQLADLFCFLFSKIEPKWALFCPEERNNCINYYYIFRQLCILTDQTQFLPYIPALRDVAKKRVLDSIWKPICALDDLAYFPSVTL